MFKKVEFEAGKVRIDGNIIGTEVGAMKNGTVVIEKDNGTFIYAVYGTMVDDEFYQLCRSHRCIGCNMAESPKCRYNRKTNQNAGYYVEVEE